jgi:hypothetical protein
MASSLNAATSGGGGVIVTSDASGDLNIQSGGSTVVAVTSTGMAVTGTLSASNGISVANTFGFKNRIINGGMVIDQRNAGASVTPTDSQFITDRFNIRLTQASKLTAQQNAGSVTPPTGFTNYLGVTSASAYSVLSTDNFNIVQIIEGYNIADFDFGKSTAKTITLSFQVYSSLTGTFGGALTNSALSRSYPFTYSIPVANTWTSISITIAGDTTGTWLTTNGQGLRVWFGLGVGSSTSGTAGSWSSNYYNSATGATSVVGTNGATFYITGVQLEKGSTATSFDFRAYSTELAMCQRYYYRRTSVSTGDVISNMSAQSTTSVWGKVLDLPVTQRSSGTCNYSAASGFTLYPANGSGGVACTGITSLTADGNAIYATGGFNGSSGLVAGYCSVLLMNSTSTWIDSSAEL